MTVGNKMPRVSVDDKAHVSKSSIALGKRHKFRIFRSPICSDAVTSKSLLSVHPSSLVEADPPFLHNLLNFSLGCLVQPSSGIPVSNIGRQVEIAG